MPGNTPIKVSVEDAHTHHHRMLEDRVLSGDGLVLGTIGRIAVSWNGKSYVIDLAKQVAGGVASKFWMYESHREGDPTLPYDADTFMFLSANNPLVTTGMIDLESGLRAFSKPGFWQVGSNNVPAQVVVSGVTKYNVPVFPYPGATGTPTGSPLMGDLDLGQKWIYHGQLVC